MSVTPLFLQCALVYSLQASIAELWGLATDVGMHGLLASQSCYHLCYPLVCTLWTKQTSLHPFDFVRNLFHLLYKVLMYMYCE